jgi:hypothetical protein
MSTENPDGTYFGDGDDTSDITLGDAFGDDLDSLTGQQDQSAFTTSILKRNPGITSVHLREPVLSTSTTNAIDSTILKLFGKKPATPPPVVTPAPAAVTPTGYDPAYGVQVPPNAVPQPAGYNAGYQANSQQYFQAGTGAATAAASTASSLLADLTNFQTPVPYIAGGVLVVGLLIWTGVIDVS